MTTNNLPATGLAEPLMRALKLCEDAYYHMIRDGDGSSIARHDAARAEFARLVAQVGQPAASADPVTVPAEIRLMADRIAADDFEHCTADPIFAVEKRRMIVGLDTDYTDQVGWFDTDSGFRVADDEAETLEANYQGTGEEPEGYVRTGYLEEWKHYATFITMESAQEFADAKGEGFRVYVDSGCRNHEWKALRAFLLGIGIARRRIEDDS